MLDHPWENEVLDEKVKKRPGHTYYVGTKDTQHQL